MQNSKKEISKNILDDYNLTPELKKHSERVSKYAEVLADLMCVDKQNISLYKKGALLHDLGKLCINKTILDKASKLSIIEFEEMKKHAELGLTLLNEKHCNNIIKNIILFHHEKWNGKGYPHGLKGSEIPLEARIISIVDCYDALTSKRVYKNKLSHKEALDILKSESGKSFDPEIVFMFSLFEKTFEDILENY